MIRLITRSDDAGSGRGANAAILKAADAGFVKNISLMAPGASIAEAAEMLKNKKHICFGMHFTMNAEWDNVKWGPVNPALAVSAMTDDRGFFHAEPAASAGAGVDIDMIHAEWNAQLDRLIALGFNVCYADTHMFPEIAFDGLADAMSLWIKEKGLIDHRYFYLTHPAMPLEDMYLTGNKDNPTEKIVDGRKRDMDFVASKDTLRLCEKYDVIPVRYDEAVYTEADRDSIKLWFGE